MDQNNINTNNRSITLIVIGIIFILLVVISMLYYFNVFKFLPGFYKTTESVSLSSLTCPISPCNLGTEMLQDEKYIGLSFDNIVAGQGVHAAFAGELEVVNSQYLNDTSNGNFPMLELSLTSLDKSLKAVYYFRGSSVKPKKVKAGDIIGVHSDEKMPQFNNKKVIFSLFKTDIAEPIRIGVNNFN